jgi:hypothetical protein
MATFEMYAETKKNGSRASIVFDVPGVEIAGMDDEQVHEYVWSEYKELLWNIVETGLIRIDNGDK